MYCIERIVTRFRLLSVALLLTLLAACTRETTIMDDDANLFNLAVNVSTRTANDANASEQEEAIESARLVAIGVDGSPYKGRVTCNRYFTKDEIGVGKVIRAQAKSGMSDVYLIVNEPASIKTEMDALLTIQNLEAVKVLFPAMPEVGKSHIPMMRCFKNINILLEPAKNAIGSNVSAESVERLWTKIRVRFRSTDAADAMNLTGMVINSVELCDIPQYSYWNAKAYNEALTPKDAKVTQNAVLAATEVDGSTPAYNFYTPEYISATKAKHSYLLVTATKDGRVSTYRLPLGEAVKLGSYDLLRNSFYDITATVRGLGETDVDVKINVLPWNKVGSESTVGSEYLTVNLVHDVINTSVKIITADISGVTVTTQQGRVTVSKESDGTIKLGVPVDKIESMLNDLPPAASVAVENEIDRVYIFDNGVRNKTITVKWKPAFIARFAKGYLCANSGGGKSKPVIGAPEATALTFKWGGLLGFSMIRVPTGSFNDLTGVDTGIQDYLDYVNEGCALPAGIPFKDSRLVSIPVGGLDADSYNLPATEDIASAKGDVCRHSLGDKWRIPTKAEMEQLINLGSKRSNSGTWDPPLSGLVAKKMNGWFFGSNLSAASVSGATVINADPIKNQTLFMRSLGSRDAGGVNSRTYAVDRELTVWTSTAFSVATIYLLVEHGNFPTTDLQIAKIGCQYGFSIRCIRK